MREIDGMSVAETADCLDITQPGETTRRHRARVLLRRRLKRAIGSAAPASFTYLGSRCDRMTRTVMERINRLT